MHSEWPLSFKGGLAFSFPAFLALGSAPEPIALALARYGLLVDKEAPQLGMALFTVRDDNESISRHALCGYRVNQAGDATMLFIAVSNKSFPH